MRAYLELLRPLNCLMAACGCLVASIIGGGPSVFVEPYLLYNVALAMVIVFLFIGAGNSLNDYYDLYIDKVNHPNRPIPSGRIRGGSALVFSIVLFVVCLPLGWLINPVSFCIVVVAMVLMIGYEKRLKRCGLSGNLAISVLVALLFLFGGSVVAQTVIESLSLISILAVLAFFATLGREITKDIEDIGGDVDRDTLPKKVGIESAGYLASISFLLSVFLSPLPFFTLFFNILYLSIVLVADVIFIYCVFILSQKPGMARGLSKVAMIIALIAFLVGSLSKGLVI